MFKSNLIYYVCVWLDKRCRINYLKWIDLIVTMNIEFNELNRKYYLKCNIKTTQHIRSTNIFKWNLEKGQEKWFDVLILISRVKMSYVHTHRGKKI